MIVARILPQLLYLDKFMLGQACYCFQRGAGGGFALDRNARGKVAGVDLTPHIQGGEGGISKQVTGVTKAKRGSSGVDGGKGVWQEGLKRSRSGDASGSGGGAGAARDIEVAIRGVGEVQREQEAGGNGLRKRE